jgi:hypothetical protein
MSTSLDRRRRSRWFVGPAILIVIGIAALANNLGFDSFAGNFASLAIGGAFLVAYAVSRRYGYLVPGGILTGVGVGLVAASLLRVADADTGAYAAIGGGVGFLLIYALDLLVSGSADRWWPVIPGSLMVVAGAGMLTGNQELMRQLGLWSPVLLIGLGVAILVARFRQPAP